MSISAFRYTGPDLWKPIRPFNAEIDCLPSSDDLAAFRYSLSRSAMAEIIRSEWEQENQECEK